jgi:hypothetical protein
LGKGDHPGFWVTISEASPKMSPMVCSPRGAVFPLNGLCFLVLCPMEFTFCMSSPQRCAAKGCGSTRSSKWYKSWSGGRAIVPQKRPRGSGKDHEVRVCVKCYTSESRAMEGRCALPGCQVPVLKRRGLRSWKSVESDCDLLEELDAGNVCHALDLKRLPVWRRVKQSKRAKLCDGHRARLRRFKAALKKDITPPAGVPARHDDTDGSESTVAADPVIHPGPKTPVRRVRRSAADGSPVILQADGDVAGEAPHGRTPLGRVDPVTAEPTGQGQGYCMVCLITYIPPAHCAGLSSSLTALSPPIGRHGPAQRRVWAGDGLCALSHPVRGFVRRQSARW